MSAYWPIITPDHHAAAKRVLDSRRLTDGPESEAFEAEFAEAVGARRAVMTTSGTAAIHAALLAYDVRSIVAPSFTFSGTVIGAVLSGMHVRWQDIDEATGHPLAYTTPADACVPVHLHGNAAPVPDRSEYRVIIEDAAQAFGTLDETGRQVGYRGHAAAWSLNASKIMWAGEGGMLTTDDDSLADEVRRIVRFGGSVTSTTRSGYNWKPDEMTAAIGRASLLHVRDWIDDARRAGEMLDDALTHSKNLTPLRIDGTPNRHKYRVRFDPRWRRHEVIKMAREANLPVKMWQHAPLPLHTGLQQPHLHSTWSDVPTGAVTYDHAMSLLSSSVIVGHEFHPLGSWTPLDGTQVGERLVETFG